MALWYIVLWYDAHIAGSFWWTWGLLVVKVMVGCFPTPHLAGIRRRLSPSLSLFSPFPINGSTGPPNPPYVDSVVMELSHLRRTCCGCTLGETFVVLLLVPWFLCDKNCGAYYYFQTAAKEEIFDYRLSRALHDREHVQQIANYFRWWIIWRPILPRQAEWCCTAKPLLSSTITWQLQNPQCTVYWRVECWQHEMQRLWWTYLLHMLVATALYHTVI